MEADQSRPRNSGLVRRANQGNVSIDRRRLGVPFKKEHQSARLEKALRKLYDILESHAPRWYTQEHHERAESALRRPGNAPADVFIELCGLLEEYAPTWYTKEHYEDANSALVKMRKAAEHRPPLKVIT